MLRRLQSRVFVAQHPLSSDALSADASATVRRMNGAR
jgi:hypothetical protein